MTLADIDRSNWRYWIDGAGAWLERWHCTSHDALLFGVMSLGVIWMVAEYLYYAHLVKQARGIFYDESFRNHLHKLMQVFLFCGVIHLFNIISWIWTPYLIWASCFWINAALASHLNKAFRRAIQSKRLSETLAESRLNEVRDVLDHVDLGDLQAQIPSKSLTELIDELRRKTG